MRCGAPPFARVSNNVPRDIPPTRRNGKPRVLLPADLHQEGLREVAQLSLANTVNGG